MVTEHYSGGQAAVDMGPCIFGKIVHQTATSSAAKKPIMLTAVIGYNDPLKNWTIIKYPQVTLKVIRQGYREVWP